LAVACLYDDVLFPIDAMVGAVGKVPFAPEAWETFKTAVASYANARPGTIPSGETLRSIAMAHSNMRHAHDGFRAAKDRPPFSEKNLTMLDALAAMTEEACLAIMRSFDDVFETCARSGGGRNSLHDR